jgi:hypothetical protein
MPDYLTQIILANQPFPDADCEGIPPQWFHLPQDCAVLSHTGLGTVVPAAGPDAAAPAGPLGAGSMPLRYTFVAPAGAACDSGARDRARSVVECALAPTSIRSPADVGENRVLLFPLNGGVTISSRLRVRFALHWIREVDSGTIDGGVGIGAGLCVEASLRATLSGAFLAAAALDESGRLRLQLFGKSASGLVVDVMRLPEPHFPGFPDALARRAWEKASTALRRICAADLSRCWKAAAPGCALLDCVFDFTPDSLAAYRTALAGQFDGVSLGAAALTEAVRGERTIQVHLPFLDRKEWPGCADALTRAETAAEEDGHIFVRTGGSWGAERQKSAGQVGLALAGPLLFPGDISRFDLTFTDRRIAPRAHVARALEAALRAFEFGDEPSRWLDTVPDAEVEASVSLSLPGALTAAWLDAPGERAPNFFEVFSKVSVAIQRASRRWLPYAYFSELERYEDLRTGYPLVFYQSTYPFSGRPRSEFSYDLVAPDNAGIARPWAFRPLVSHLARVHQVLIEAGRPRLARLYETWRAREIVAGIARQPGLINALLTNDACFVDHFVGLGLEARALSARLAADPRKAAREMTAFVSHFAVTLHRKLRHLYAGWGFEAFGSLLLLEATRALATALDGSAAITATLRLSAESREHVFVSSPAPR